MRSSRWDSWVNNLDETELSRQTGAISQISQAGSLQEERQTPNKRSLDRHTTEQLTGYLHGEMIVYFLKVYQIRWNQIQEQSVESVKAVELKWERLELQLRVSSELDFKTLQLSSTLFLQVLSECSK